MGSTVENNGADKNKGNFLSGSHARCTARSKRSQVQCRGIAVTGSTTCRMHGGTSPKGAANHAFRHGRHSKYLPSQMKELYDEATSNPDILEMGEHIALLEAKINGSLQSMQEGEPVPRWENVRAVFDVHATAVLGGDQEAVTSSMADIFEMLDAGQKWDRAWDEILRSMEQLRKMADVEVKRRKEMNLMVPIERVVVLMAAVGQAVKRNVTNPLQIQAVQHELKLIYTGSGTAHRPTGKAKMRLAPQIIDVPGRKRRETVNNEEEAE